MSQCKSCKAEIFWAVTGKGKRHPVNAKPEKRFVLIP